MDTHPEDSPAGSTGRAALDCSAFRTALNECFHAEPSAERRAEVERHARVCRPCGDLLDVCRELSCREFVGFLDAYVAGELAPERRTVFERHIGICPDCANYLDSYRATMRISGLALREGESPPREVPEALVRGILAARRTKRRRAR